MLISIHLKTSSDVEANNYPLYFFAVQKLTEHCLVVRKFSSKNAQFGGDNPPFWENFKVRL